MTPTDYYEVYTLLTGGSWSIVLADCLLARFATAEDAAQALLDKHGDVYRNKDTFRVINARTRVMKDVRFRYVEPVAGGWRVTR